MTSLRHNKSIRRGPTLDHRLPLDLAVGSISLITVVITTTLVFDLSNAYLVLAGFKYIVLTALILRVFQGSEADREFGVANRVTLTRSTLIFAVSALLFESSPFKNEVYWWTIALSTIALILDGIDGMVARRTRTNTTFGARFDMELDAFLMLALSILVWQTGKVGPWVIGIGAFRYVFVFAGWLWSPLAAELPPSRRRKTVCVVESIALLVCLGPVIPTNIAVGVAAGALLLLTYSFAIDVRWLILRAFSSPPLAT